MIAGKKNVGFGDKSVASSPMRGSPTKGSRAGTQSEADTQSNATGFKSSPIKGGAMSMFNGGGGMM